MSNQSVVKTALKVFGVAFAGFFTGSLSVHYIMQPDTTIYYDRAKEAELAELARIKKEKQNSSPTLPPNGFIPETVLSPHQPPKIREKDL